MSRDVPLGTQRSLAAGQPSTHFNLVGLHWRGPGAVQFRTRSLAGRWSALGRPRRPRPRISPTWVRTSAPAWPRGGWATPGGSGRPTGSSTACAARSTRLRAYFVWSPPAGVPARTLQKAGSPPIVPRSGWSADEKIRRAAPRYAPAIRLAVVHHTAGANGYTAAQSPAIVRAIELYHVKGNGWNDIGYNFLVDRFGHGLRGPLRRHRAERHRRARRGLQHRLGRRRGDRRVQLAGRLGRRRATRSRGCSPGGSTSRTSTRVDVDVRLRRQSALPGRRRRSFSAPSPVTGTRASPTARGRRSTTCSSTIAGEVRDDRAAEALRAGGDRSVPGGLVRFRARLSSPLAVDRRRARRRGKRRVEPRGSARTSTGRGTPRSAPPGSYSYAIRCDGDVTPAVGTIGGGGRAGALSVTGLVADPATVTPERRRRRRQTTITYTLTEPANVTVTLRDALGAGCSATIAAERGSGPARTRCVSTPARAAGRRLPGRDRGNRRPAAVRRPPRRRSP